MVIYHKGMKRWALILFFLPVTAFANVGDDLNDLIQRFFGSGQDPVEMPIEEPISDIELPDFATDENLDLRALRESIMLEEESLANFEADIYDKEAALSRLNTENNSAQNQLFLLDEQIGFNTQKYEQYLELEAKWKTELEGLTREKSEIKALLRQSEREYKKFMSKNFIQKENLESDPEISVLQWLFSSRSVSEILEDRRNQAILANQKSESLAQLNAVKRALDAQEKKTVLLYDRMNYLARQVSREKLVLSNMAELKAKLLAKNEANKDELEAALAFAREKQVDSTIYLQELRQRLDEVFVEEDVVDEVVLETSSDPGEEDLSIFDWPLAIPIQIEAVFKDPEYEAEFSREHEGIDIFAEQGTSVLAPADGIVEKVVSNGYGYSYLILKHEEDLFTVYGHLSKMLVSKGDVISYGQEIALTGGTPGTPGAGFFTSGPHLHFEVFHDGAHRNPLNYLPGL